MKTEEKEKTVVRRYSDHPVVQKKISETREMLDKADLSFLNNPPAKKK